MIPLGLFPHKIRSKSLALSLFYMNRIAPSVRLDPVTIEKCDIKSLSQQDQGTSLQVQFSTIKRKHHSMLLDNTHNMQLRQSMDSSCLGRDGFKGSMHLTNRLYAHQENNFALTTTGISRRYYVSFDNRKIDDKQAAARSILGLPANKPYTYSELRRSYFEGAKLCHPDSSDEGEKVKDLKPAARFLDLSNAYEFLLRNIRVKDGETEHDEFNQDEETVYRESCYNVMGTSAELVEEIKRDGMFLQWLQGRTGAARSWRIFFMMNGGLAPKKLKFGVIENNGMANDCVMINGIKRRRRRPLLR